MSARGTLFVVATPIGNLEDLSPRAIAVLRGAAAIYCEDTRVTGKLAARFGLSAPRISCHAHNETARVAGLIERLDRGESVALVSDAGTPALSDPGQHAVAAAAAAGHAIVAVPGPSAAAAALSISGLPAVPHLFAGFPPAKSGARRAFFERLVARSETIVYFEAPHRLPASLADAAAVFGARRAVVARELTKIHEEALRGTLAEIRDRLAARGKVLGECVVVIEGAGTAAASAAPEDVDAAIDRLESEGLSAREISKRVARAFGLPARTVYARILRRKSGPASE
jgi:16S rRNA (cytidine1402-2'-O)-methyltransferase